MAGVRPGTSQSPAAQLLHAGEVGLAATGPGSTSSAARPCRSRYETKESQIPDRSVLVIFASEIHGRAIANGCRTIRGVATIDRLRRG